MALSTVFVIAFLILFGLDLLTWVAVGSVLLGAVALIAGVLMLLEALGAFSYKVGQ